MRTKRTKKKKKKKIGTSHSVIYFYQPQVYRKSSFYKIITVLILKCPNNIEIQV